MRPLVADILITKQRRKMLYRVHYCRNICESVGFEWFSTKVEALWALQAWYKENRYDEFRASSSFPEEEKHEKAWEDLLLRNLQSFKVPGGKKGLLKFLNREAVYADKGSA